MLRVLVIGVVMVGCRDRTSPPTAKAPSDPIATLRELADEVCACKDVACRDRIRGAWDVATRTPPDFKDPKKVTQPEIIDEVAQSAAHDEVRTRYLACLEPEHGPAKMIARVKDYADRACACDQSDASCLSTVNTEEERYLGDTWTQQDGFTDADRDALTQQMKKFQICVQRAR